MSNFIDVIDYFFTVLGQLFNLMVSNWFFGFLFLTLIFSFIVNLYLIVKGSR